MGPNGPTVTMVRRDEPPASQGPDEPASPVTSIEAFKAVDRAANSLESAQGVIDVRTTKNRVPSIADDDVAAALQYVAFVELDAGDPRDMDFVDRLTKVAHREGLSIERLGYYMQSSEGPIRLGKQADDDVAFSDSRAVFVRFRLQA